MSSARGQTRARSERGQTSVELLMMVPLVFLVALCVWQMHLVMSVATDAENAARTAARKGGGLDAVARALQPEYRDRLVRCGDGEEGACSAAGGGSARVVVRVPIVAPFGDWTMKVKAEANMPQGL